MLSIVLIGLLFIWLITTIGLWLVTMIVPGVKANSTGDLLLAALVLGIMNAIIRPLLWILTLPLTVLSFGLFALVINAIMIKITATLVSGFIVDGFGNALLAALIMAIVAIIGFILVQWFMFNAIFWMQASSTHQSYSI